MKTVFGEKGEKLNAEMVRGWILKVVIAGSEDSPSSEEASGSGLEVEVSQIPRVPSLSPAKMRGLFGVGWKAR